MIGARPIENIEHFSPVKKLLQRLGSSIVRRVSGTDVADAPSGFRAMSKDVALMLNVFNGYTYTLETIIQAGQHNMTVVSVPIRVNGDLRPSRLVRSIPNYIKRSMVTMFRIFIVYQPLRFFLSVSMVPFTLGLLVGARYLYYFTQGIGGHVQSLILSAVLLILGFLIFLLAILGDLLSVNRRLLEELQRRERRRRLGVESLSTTPSLRPTPLPHEDPGRVY